MNPRTTIIEFTPKILNTLLDYGCTKISMYIYLIHILTQCLYSSLISIEMFSKIMRIGFGLTKLSPTRVWGGGGFVEVVREKRD